MKTRLFPLIASLALFAGPSFSFAAPAKKPENVTITFENPENFTDVRENNSNNTSDRYLEELRDYVQETAAPLLRAGEKLTVTFTDIDLAGDVRFDRPNGVRVMTGATAPHLHLKFQLFNSGGAVAREGERRLSDLDYQNQARLPGYEQPLYYEKQLLKQWLQKELKSKS